MEDLTIIAEEAASRGEQAQVYKVTKLDSGKYRGANDIPIVDKQGRLLTTEAEQETRWAEHFSDVLNRPPPTVDAELQDPDTDLDVNTASPEKEEINTAIKSSRTEKPRDRTTSLDSSSRQIQNLHHKLFSHSLQQYGRRNQNLTTGHREDSKKKEI